MRQNRLIAAFIVGATALISLAVIPASAATLPALTPPLDCPAGATYVESRDWWTPTGVSFDRYRGVDVGICLPASGSISGTYHTTLHLTMRENPATLDRVNVYISSASYNVLAYTNTAVRLTGSATSSVSVDLPVAINTTLAGNDGWQELRFQSRVTHDSDNGQLMLATTGWQFNVQNGHTEHASYRSLPWTETRGWYNAGPYVHARFFSPLPVSAVSGTYSFTVSYPEGGGHTYVDANTRADPMIFPLDLHCTTSCSLDTRLLADGWHSLTLRSDRGQAGGTSSGLEVIFFRVANGTPTPTPTVAPTPSPTIAPTPTPTEAPTPTPTPLPSSCA